MGGKNLYHADDRIATTLKHQTDGFSDILTCPENSRGLKQQNAIDADMIPFLDLRNRMLDHRYHRNLRLPQVRKGLRNGTAPSQVLAMDAISGSSVETIVL